VDFFLCHAVYIYHQIGIKASNTFSMVSLPHLLVQHQEFHKQEVLGGLKCHLNINASYWSWKGYLSRCATKLWRKLHPEI